MASGSLVPLWRRVHVLGARGDRQGSGGHPRDRRSRGRLGQARSAVREVLSEPADAAWIETHLRSLVGLGTPEQAHGDQRQAAFAAWRRFLEAVAQEHTLVLVFEDIHCADGGLLDFIEYLLAWARNVRILVICTARPEALADTRPGWGESELGAGELPTTIELGPLSRQETGRLVAKLAGRGIRKGTKTAIVGAASGNPLYAVEYVRMLEGRPGEELVVPETVQAIIASRLDSLSARDKALLQDGAVVGRVVWPGALAALGGRSKASVERHLLELVRKEFLVRVRPSSVEEISSSDSATRSSGTSPTSRSLTPGAARLTGGRPNGSKR